MGPPPAEIGIGVKYTVSWVAGKSIPLVSQTDFWNIERHLSGGEGTRISEVGGVVPTRYI